MNEFSINGVTYRQQYRKCGKEGCKCQDGEGHGPYWYSMGESGGLKYVGKELPPKILEFLQRLETNREPLKATLAASRQRLKSLQEDCYRAEREVSNIRALLEGQRTDPQVLRSAGLEAYILE